MKKADFLKLMLTEKDKKMIEWLVNEKKFSPTAALKCLTTFKETMKFAGLILVLASVCLGQSMSSQKTISSWNVPTPESSFNHCLTSNEAQNCWITPPGTAVYVDSNFGHTLAVDASCNGYVYNDGKANNWTKHPEWGCVKEITYDSNGVLYGLVHYSSAGKGYALSSWDGTKWNDISCCFQSFRMRFGLMVAYDINGTLWISKNHGSSPYSQAWCDPDGPAAVAAQGFDANGGPVFYVACNSTKIWEFKNNTWTQLPGAATAIARGNGAGIYIVGTGGDVEHYNGTGWDDIVTNKPVTSLAVDNRSNIWMVGPKTSNGSNVYRLWENGFLFTHSYGGSVSCGQGVPQALCETFTHQVHHQICFGTQCGPISTSSWNGQGGWGPDAHYFARPLDLDNCLLADEPPGPCGLAENEASMECSGGGSNNDGAPSPIIAFEIAYTKLESTGAPSCGYATDLEYVCTYPVTPGCDNTDSPNFNPSYINATAPDPHTAASYLSFDSTSFCWDINHGGWHCLSGNVGSADVDYTTFTQSNVCTDTAP